MKYEVSDFNPSTGNFSSELWQFFALIWWVLDACFILFTKSFVTNLYGS